MAQLRPVGHRPLFLTLTGEHASPFFSAIDQPPSGIQKLPTPPRHLNRDQNCFNSSLSGCGLFKCVVPLKSEKHFVVLAPRPQYCVLSHVTRLWAPCQFHVGNDLGITWPTYSTFGKRWRAINQNSRTHDSSVPLPEEQGEGSSRWLVRRHFPQ
jgi:hypothetical protein